MRLYATPLGIVCADSAKDCRAVLAIFGADPKARIEPLRRARGMVFAVQAHIEPDKIDAHVEKFKWMGPDEQRRELTKLQDLPPEYGPLFGLTEQKTDAETDAETDTENTDTENVK